MINYFSNDNVQPNHNGLRYGDARHDNRRRFLETRFIVDAKGDESRPCHRCNDVSPICKTLAKKALCHHPRFAHWEGEAHGQVLLQDLPLQRQDQDDDQVRLPGQPPQVTTIMIRSA